MLASYIFILGLAFGSFALALADRLHAKTNWVSDRSRCDKCKKVLQPIDLIPIISWLASRGRCRYCKTKLSPMYPAVELGLAAAFTVSYLALPYDLSGLGITLFVLWCGALIISTALFVYDLRWYLLPNKLVYALVAVAFVHRAIYTFYTDSILAVDVVNAAVSVSVAAGFFWILYYVSKGKWIGYGDVRLGLAIGLILPNGLVAWLALCVASVVGLLFALPQLPKNKHKMTLKIPFGPFLIIGMWFAYIWGERLISWYTETFLYL